MMKAEDLRTKTPDELKKLLLEARKGQFNARFQRANGQPEKPSDMRRTRRTIARIKTFLNAKNNNKDQVAQGKTVSAKGKAKAAPKAKASKTAA